MEVGETWELDVVNMTWMRQASEWTTVAKKKKDGKRDGKR
jgi:hypothetical protein